MITELECELAFAKLGFPVLKPICDNYRYDYIVDIGTRFIRIQCKTCRVNQDKTKLEFSGRSVHINSQKSTQLVYTKDEIDYFFTYYNDVSYLIPIENGLKSYTLRLDETKNNQKNNVRLAKDYELKKILTTIENVTISSIETKVKYDKINKCKKCGIPIISTSIYCSKCSNDIQKEQSKFYSVSRKTFKKEIRIYSFTQVAKEYKVSRSTIKRWCKNFKLPTIKQEINSYTDEEWEKI